MVEMISAPVSGSLVAGLILEFKKSIRLKVERQKGERRGSSTRGTRADSHVVQDLCYRISQLTWEILGKNRFVFISVGCGHYHADHGLHVFESLGKLRDFWIVLLEVLPLW